MAVGWQVILRLGDDRVLTPTPSLRRTFADTVLRVGRRRRVFAFEAPDTHCHVAAQCTEAEAKRLSHDLVEALGPALGHPVAFEPPRRTEIRDQWHLENVFGYVLNQKEHHRVGGDPGRESSNLPDLLGMRVTGAWTAGLVREILPRVDRGRLLALLGVEALADGWELGLLADCAAAADGLPDLRRRSARHVGARASAVRVADVAGVPTTLIAETLAVSARTVRNLRLQPPRPALDAAVRRQMGLRLQLGRASSVFLGEPAQAYVSG